LCLPFLKLLNIYGLVRRQHTWISTIDGLKDYLLSGWGRAFTHSLHPAFVDLCFYRYGPEYNCDCALQIRYGSPAVRPGHAGACLITSSSVNKSRDYGVTIGRVPGLLHTVHICCLPPTHLTRTHYRCCYCAARMLPAHAGTHGGVM
jgi:hypothetical protein